MEGQEQTVPGVELFERPAQRPPIDRSIEIALRCRGDQVQLDDAPAAARGAQRGPDDMAQAARLRMEIVRRWAVPFACLVFAILGVPLATGARGGRGSAYLITLSAFVTFYALSRLALALKEAGWNQWVAGLMPNTVILIAGIVLTARTVTRGIGKPQ